MQRSKHVQALADSYRTKSIHTITLTKRVTSPSPHTRARVCYRKLAARGNTKQIVARQSEGGTKSESDLEPSARKSEERGERQTAVTRYAGFCGQSRSLVLRLLLLLPPLSSCAREQCRSALRSKLNAVLLKCSRASASTFLDGQVCSLTHCVIVRFHHTLSCRTFLRCLVYMSF